jgi:succinate dehydrogenase / fumarate reductase cytochrome b subunit
MSGIARFLTSSLGRKILMALTGLLLSLFLVAHLAGNVLIFVSAEAFNGYSHTLLSNPLIYIAEAGLLLLFVAHFVSGILVYLQNRAARPTPYQVNKRAGHSSEKSVASSTMIFSGIFLLVFVPLHLKTFKFGGHYETTTEPVMRDLHRLVIEIFQNPLYVLFYVIGMAIIGFHLWHGVGSAFQTAGIYYRKGFLRFGQVFAVIIAGGFLIISILISLMGNRL